jgi:hypothetical protein
MPAKVKYTGFFAWLHNFNVTVKQINELAQANLYVQEDRFMKDRNGFSIRFSQSAYSRLALTKRTPATILRKMKRFGRDLPYHSILKNPSGGQHMKDLLVLPGVGYSLRATSASQVAKVTLKLPGARKLNNLSTGGKKPVVNAAKYREELIGFYAGARWQATEILTKALDNFKRDVIAASLAADEKQV